MRKKDSTAASTATSTKAAGDGKDSASRSVNRGRSIEPPADRRIEPIELTEPPEPPEPPKPQPPTQTIAKKAGRRRRQKVASQLE